MLKKRLAAVLTVNNGLLVQSFNFKRYLPVGAPDIAVEFLNSWGIDEIIYLDISASRSSRGPNYNLVQNISKKCFVPLTVGGGIKSVDDMLQLVKIGADKIAINTSLFENPSIIHDGAAILGNQCIVASIDIKLDSNRRYVVFTKSNAKIPEKNPVKWSQTLASLGAGELLINSVDRDGSATGYDLNLITSIVQSVNIPVIACGGAGTPEDFVKVIRNGASCAAAGNIFHHTEHSVIVSKAYMHKSGIDARLDTQANYSGFKFDNKKRISKRTDDYLAHQKFKYYKKEII